MTWPLLGLLAIVYLGGIKLLLHKQWRLSLYLWGAFGLAFLLIHTALMQNWHTALAAIEAQQLQGLMSVLGVRLELIDHTTLLVPDQTGWSGLKIGVESSTLIEMTVLSGLLLFYPKLSWRRRGLSLMAGLTATYLLNLVRLSLIVVMILVWGKPIVPLAHTVIGRLVYFAGVVSLYWFLLTKPTLSIVRQFIQETGRERN